MMRNPSELPTQGAQAMAAFSKRTGHAMTLQCLSMDASDVQSLLYG